MMNVPGNLFFMIRRKKMNDHTKKTSHTIENIVITLAIIFVIGIGTGIYYAAIQKGVKQGIEMERATWKQRCLDSGHAHYDETTGEFIFHDVNYIDKYIKENFPNLFEEMKNLPVDNPPLT